MVIAQVIVNIVGLAFIGLIVWHFWLYPRRRVAAVPVGGAQEVRIRVRGGYDPDVIVVKAGRPVRLHFYREEESPCSAQVIFSELARSAELAPFQDTVVEVTPPAPGEYDFQCGMGMLRGKIIAEQ